MLASQKHPQDPMEVALLQLFTCNSVSWNRAHPTWAFVNVLFQIGYLLTILGIPFFSGIDDDNLCLGSSRIFCLFSSGERHSCLL